MNDVKTCTILMAGTTEDLAHHLWIGHVPDSRPRPGPVHLIQTASDVAVPVEVGEWLAEAMPDATLDVIEASGHLPHITAPDEVRRILER